MRNLNYGVVGCGWMGREHLRNIRLLDGCRVTAIYEPNADMRAAARDEAPDAVFTDTIKELVDLESVDCLVIASPNYLHVDHLKEITALRTLPILVEKPIATRSDDRAYILNLHKTYGAPIWVAMEYRFIPPIARFLEQAQEVTGGVRMLTIREHRFPFLDKVDAWNRFNRYSGGTLVEKCCHFFDLMRLIVGSEPARIMGSGGQASNHTDERYGGEQPDVWDSAYSIVDFDNGARAMLDLCMFGEGSEYQEEICAVGPRGKIECFVPGPDRLWPEGAGAPPVPKVVISPREPKGPQSFDVPIDETLQTAGDHHGSTFYQHKAFREAISNGGKPAVSLFDGWMAVAMGLAAQQSSAEDRVVRLADDMPQLRYG